MSWRHLPNVQTRLWGAQQAIYRVCWMRGKGRWPERVAWRLRLFSALLRGDALRALDILELTSPMVAGQSLTPPEKSR